MLFRSLANSLLPVDDFLKSVAQHPPTRVKGTAVFLAGNPDGTPLALMHNLKHNKTLHDRIVLLTVLVEELAGPPDSVFEVEKLNFGCTHAEVSAELAVRWRFHADVVDALFTAGDPLAAQPFSHMGGLLRVAPNHTCMTAAAHDRYFVVDGDDEVIAVWPRLNGW